MGVLPKYTSQWRSRGSLAQVWGEHVQVANRARGRFSSDGDQELRAHNVRVSPDRQSEPEVSPHEAGENALMRTVRALAEQLLTS